MKGVALMEMGTIIPIVLAILIFFGAVVSAMNTVEEKNRRIDMVFSLIQIVDRITEAGVITDERFTETVEVLRETLPVSFYVCVTEYDGSFNNCKLRASKPEGIYNIESFLGRMKADYISATFPVIYQRMEQGVPFNEVYKMLVVVWQGA